MPKKPSSVLGVDIGSQRIKVCEVKVQGKEPVVTALAIADTPEGSVDHTGIFNPDAVGIALKQLIKDSGATSNQCVITIAGQASVLVRTLEVPKMNAAELKDHMGWEINRNIPFAESTVVSDFKPLGGDDPNSPNMDVVMAIAPQSAIDTVMACVKKAGRQTNAIDVEPLSLARALQNSYDEVLGDKTVCVVEVGSKTTSINIYRGSKLLMPRQVPLGGEMFTKAIADAYTMNMADAEQSKVTKALIPSSVIAMAGQQMTPFGGFGGDLQNYNPFADDAAVPTYGSSEPTGAYSSGNPYSPEESHYAPGETAYGTPDPYAAADPYAVPQDSAYSEPETTPFVVPATEDHTPAIEEDPEVMRLYQAFAPVLDELVSEVRRSIDYYRSRGGDVDLVELCGGGTLLKGLEEFLTQALGQTCDAFDPLRRLNVNSKKVSPEFVMEHKQEFAVAIGNGLHIFFD